MLWFTLGEGGFWIGMFETLIFFASILMERAWPLGAAWLVFKTAIYWQNTNFAQLPDRPPRGSDAAKYVVERHILGRYSATKILVGTGGSIVSALIGAALVIWLG